MQKIYFVFGPEGSFFFAGPKGFESAGLPTGVETRIATAASVVNIAVGDRGESNDPIVFIAFTKKEDSRVWTWWSASFEQAVKETTSVLDIVVLRHCRFAFGERGHFFAWTAQGHWKCRSPGGILPSGTLPINNHEVEIDYASLGVEDSYLIVAKDGRCWWNTRSHYPALQAILDEAKPGDIIASFAALNPFRVGQFFILFANNTAVFQVPLSYRSKLESALKKHGITCTALTSQQAEKKVKMPNAAKRPDFAKRLLKDVTGPVVGAVVSGIASALIGAVACTVM